MTVKAQRIGRMALQAATRTNPRLSPADDVHTGGYVPQELLAATAHEMRLPLSHIKGFVTSLRRTDVDWDQETRNDFLAEIEGETDRLAQLVDALLADRSLNATVTPKYELTLTSPARVIQGGLNRVGDLPRERPLRVDVQPSLPAVWMDPPRMERVVANLVQNAIKYSPPGGAVGVSARLTESGELELAVEDEGSGIPAEDRQRIFQPFFRKHSAFASEVPGHGLGLAICQSIVLAHGGRIEVNDRPAGGACFKVFLPGPANSRTQLRSEVMTHQSSLVVGDEAIRKLRRAISRRTAARYAPPPAARKH